MRTPKESLDSESLRGKVYLLVIDKLILGAIVAVAFVLYDGHRRTDDRAYQAKAAQVQLNFEQARLAREFLPNIFDDSANVAMRGYLLRAGVVTGSIDVESGITIASQLQRKGLSQQDFLLIVKPMFPCGVAGVMRRANELSEEYASIVAPAEKRAPRIEQIEKEKLLWRTAFESSLLSEPGKPCLPALESPQFLAENLNGLYFLLKDCSEGEATDLSFRMPRGFRLIDQLRRLKRNPLDKDVLAYFSNELHQDLQSTDGTSLAIAVVRVLRFHIPDLYGPVAEPIAMLAIAEPPKSARDKGGEDLRIIQKFSNLRSQALVLLHRMTKLGPEEKRRASVKAAEAILVAGLARLRYRLEKIRKDDGQELQRLSEEYPKGQVLLAIDIFRGNPSTKATQGMRALLDVGPERLRALGVEEYLSVVLEEKAAPNPPASADALRR